MWQARWLVCVVAVVVCFAGLCEGRYLPTRGDDARLQEIRDMLKEILERVAEGGMSTSSGSGLGGVRLGGYDKRYIYKRSAPSTLALTGDAEVPQPLLNLPQ